MEKQIGGSIIPFSNEPRSLGQEVPRYRIPVQLNPYRSWVDMVREFHEKYVVPVLGHPADVDELPQKLINLRATLHAEEFDELYNGMLYDDVEAISDAIADLIYVLIGTALCYGIPLAEVFAEVHRSNMTKDGSKREDGKILKGDSFEPPRIKEILDRYAQGSSTA